MPDSITVQNQPTDYFSRLMNSIKGIGVGLVIFIISFVVLFNSEGGTDYSKIAEKALSVDSSTMDVNVNNGNFVALRGNLVAEGTIGDQVSFADGNAVTVKAGPYVSLNRKVDYYVWTEKSETKSGSNSNSSTTTYTYSKKWSDSIPDSSNFNLPTGHENPVKTIEDNSVKAGSAKVGNQTVDLGKLTLPETAKLALNSQNVEISTVPVITTPAIVAPVTQSVTTITATPDLAVTTPVVSSRKATLVDGSFIYFGTSYAQPGLGDMRVSYDVVKSGNLVTAFGKIEGNSLATYFEGEKSLYRAFYGTKEEAMAKMHGEFVMFLWLMRIVGFFLMWMGLSMIFSPISAVLDFLPFIGGMSKSVISGITFVVALLLTVVTVLVSKVVHNPLIMVVVVLILSAGVYFWVAGHTKKQVGPTA